jgi:uncharacterized protein
LSSAELLLLVAGAVVAGFVQGLSGFAFSMVSMAIWVWVLDPKLTAVMAVFGSLVGQMIGLFTVPRKMSWRELAPLVLGGLAGIPLGVLLLPRLDADAFRFGLGALLIVACPAMLFSARLPRIALRSALLGRVALGAASLPLSAEESSTETLSRAVSARSGRQRNPASCSLRRSCRRP